MWCGIQPIYEPRPRSDGGSDSKRVILGELERFEVVEHHRFAQLAVHCLQRFCVEQDSVASEARADPADRRRGAIQCAGDLAQRGTTDDSRRDLAQQLRSLAVVRYREGLARERSLTRQTEESRDPLSALRRVGRVLVKTVSRTPTEMLRTLPPGAEWRLKVAAVLDRGRGPVHTPASARCEPDPNRPKLSTFPFPRLLRRHRRPNTDRR